MAWLAVPALAIAWLLQELNTLPLLAIPATAWVAMTLFAWCLVGQRAAVLILLGAWTLCHARWLIETRLPESLARQDFVVRGVVCDFPRTDPEAVRLLLDVERDRGLPQLPARLHLSWYDTAPALQPGERWQLLVRLKPPRGFANPAGFDFERWLYERRIGATGYVRPSTLNQRLPALSPISAAACPVGAARSQLARDIEHALGAHPGAGYVLGVAVGATHRLTQADWELLRRTGTTHLLAISGLNIAMVALPFLLLGPLLGRALPVFAGRPHAGIVPALMTAAVYSALSGFAVSTVRALIMLSLGAALAMRRRRVEGGDLLSAAAMAVLVIDPAAVVSISFWLSFAAVAWLFVAALRPERLSGTSTLGVGHQPAWWRYAWRPVIVLLRVQFVLALGLAPLTVAWFHQISVIAPLTNLVAVPVFSFAVMPLTLAGSAVLMMSPVGGRIMLETAANVVSWLVDLLRVAAAWPLSTWQPPPTSAVGLICAACGAALICWWRPLPLRSLALFCLLPLLAGSIHGSIRLRVTVMDVGQGLSVLVQTAQHSLLYDAGPAFRLRDAGESVVLPVLRDSGVTHLDALMISHDDQDHRGGAASVLETFTDARLIASSRGDLAVQRFQPCKAGLSWRWDDVDFRVISPHAEMARWSDNNDSCVLRIESVGISFLLPGDIERRREEDLLRRAVLEAADVVLAPHHGSRSSSSPLFVSAIRPRYVVFSAGYLNRWNFPAAEVRQRWLEAGACLLNTAANGAVVFEISAPGRVDLQRRERVDGAHLWTASSDAGSSCVARADP